MLVAKGGGKAPKRCGLRVATAAAPGELIQRTQGKSTVQRALYVQRKPSARPRILARSFLMLAALPCWLALAGCSTVLVRPDVEDYASLPAQRHSEPKVRKLRALLASQPRPNCEYKGSEADRLDADLWARLKLDYERHCFEHAEALVRRRLRALQVSGLCEIPRVVHRQRFLRATSSF
jgi:hypothetical protein